jgi:hypothetical protein
MDWGGCPTLPRGTTLPRSTIDLAGVPDPFAV